MYSGPDKCQNENKEKIVRLQTYRVRHPQMRNSMSNHTCHHSRSAASASQLIALPFLQTARYKLITVAGVCPTDLHPLNGVECNFASCVRQNRVVWRYVQIQFKWNCIRKMLKRRTAPVADDVKHWLTARNAHAGPDSLCLLWRKC